MADTRRLVFEFIAIDRISKATTKMSASMDHVGKKFSAVGASAKAGIAGAAVGGVLLLGKAIVQGVKDAASYETLLKKTAAVIKSTGGAANVTVDHVKNLAGSLESLSGVDEELIINSENVLATFTRIKNSKTQDTFDQGTKAALNMSSALGTDLKNSTILVGKALNDPIKGITSLRRVGVTFNKTQIDTIKKLEESGHHEKAQALILKELNKEFGGAAKAAGSGFAGSLARAKDAVQDSFRAVGQKLLPILTRLASWFATKGWPAVLKFAAVMQNKLGPPIRQITQWVSQRLMPVIQRLAAFFLTKIVPAVVKLAKAVGATLLANFKKLAGTVKEQEPHYRGLLTVLGKVAVFIGKNLIPVLKVLIKIFITAMVTALRIIITVIGTVIAVLGKLWRAGNTARKFIVSAAKAMGKAWDSFKNYIKIGTLTIIKIFATMVSALISGAARAFGWVPGIGPKLRRAASDVRKWKDDVNAELRKIKGPKPVNFTVTAHGSIFGPGNKKLGAAAKGGAIKALDSGSSRQYDSVPYLLRVDEHVWTPEEVDSVGGHRKMLKLRQMARQGLLRTAASGGPVTNRLQSMASFRRNVNNPINAGMSALTGALAKQLAAIWKKYAASGGGVVAAARRMIGYPYSWGGGGKGGPSYGIGRGSGTYGFDCSGLSQYAWWQARHIDIGGTTGPQAAGSSRSARRPGALGFVGNNPIHHVMIASDRPGYVIQAPHTGSYVQEVRRSSSNWRWPNRAYNGGAVARLGARAISGPAPNALAALARMLGIAGDPLKRRARGGPAAAGMSYLVGEYGPEIYSPTRTGTIHRTGSTVVHVNVNVGHAMASKREIADEVLSALRTVKKSGVRVDV